MEKKKHAPKQHVGHPVDDPPFVAEPEPEHVSDVEAALQIPRSRMPSRMELAPLLPIDGPFNSAYWYEDNGAMRLMAVKTVVSDTGEVTQRVFTAGIYENPAANQIVNMLDALFVP